MAAYRTYCAMIAKPRWPKSMRSPYLPLYDIEIAPLFQFTSSFFRAMSVVLILTSLLKSAWLHSREYWVTSRARQCSSAKPIHWQVKRKSKAQYLRIIFMQPQSRLWVELHRVTYLQTLNSLMHNFPLRISLKVWFEINCMERSRRG